MKKRSELSFKALANKAGLFSHKYGDVRYCAVCSSPLPKSENAPDYVVARNVLWVECKGGEGPWNWQEISETGARVNQRQFLLSHPSALFIELGAGRAPNGKGAWMMPFYIWVDQIEPYLITNNIKSLAFERRPRVPSILEMPRFEPWRLEWDKGAWLWPTIWTAL